MFQAGVSLYSLDGRVLWRVNVPSWGETDSRVLWAQKPKKLSHTGPLTLPPDVTKPVEK